MTGLVKNVRAKLDPRCIVNGRLKKKGCEVSLKNAPRTRAIVDFDKPNSLSDPHSPRCDYLFFAEENGGVNYIAPLELKRGSLEADEVVRQLQAGASVAESLVPQEESITFRPVAASGRTPKAQRNKLKNRSNKIRFRGHTEAVRLISCGKLLIEALRP